MAHKPEIFRSYIEELKKLIAELNLYKANEYFYSDVMMNYVRRYNLIVQKYKESTGIPLERFELKDFDYSNSQKTVRANAVDRMIINIESTINLANAKLEEIKDENSGTTFKPHQMRSCPKMKYNGCPLNPKLDNLKVFVGMPFADEYKDSYEYGIKLAIEGMAYKPYMANNDISTKDILCKLCNEMQSSRLLIFNISGLNPNVMLELGLSYGLGKETIVVKDKNTKCITDLASIQYIEYSHAGDLRDKLIHYLQQK